MNYQNAIVRLFLFQDPSIQNYKRIVSTKPKERFQADTTNLPSEMKNTNLQFLLIFKDHFSRLVWAFTVDDNFTGISYSFKELFSLFIAY